jgi:hypothetical protein
MADLAQLDLKGRGGEARTRALLEDVVTYHQGVYPHYRLGLAVWFGKSQAEPVQKLLELFTIPQKSKVEGPTRFSLHWKTGSTEPPFVDVYATSVDYFSQQLHSNPTSLSAFLQTPEVLYFDKQIVNSEILELFRVITEPRGLMKGWYLPGDQVKGKTLRSLMAECDHFKPQIGLVKIEESPDFQFCRGLVHVEVNQKWLPLSLGGLKIHTFFNDLQDGRPGYFLFQGGSLYRLLKFEVKTAPEYSSMVLEPSRDARYPEVYLRSVPSPEHPSA